MECRKIISENIHVIFKNEVVAHSIRILLVLHIPDAANQLHYLTTVSGFPVSYGGNAEYYPIRESFQAALLASMEQAKQTIFMVWRNLT